jgi:hypothetical protein
MLMTYPIKRTIGFSVKPFLYTLNFCVMRYHILPPWVDTEWRLIKIKGWLDPLSKQLPIKVEGWLARMRLPMLSVKCARSVYATTHVKC